MTTYQPQAELSGSVDPERLDHWFAPEHQSGYVAILQGRGGLTRRRAEYFVRLWAYLLLKQSHNSQQSLEALTQLSPTKNLISCTHREAAALFYGQQERGSDRSAGMMIDQFAALGLLEKRFDGQTLCLRICPLPELAIAPKAEEPVKLQADEFNPRTDAIPVAGLIRQAYAMTADDSAVSTQRIARILRQWATEYPQGLRVLRRCDNHNPVGAAICFPVASESEDFFSRPPAKSFYLTSNVDVDPVKLAKPGDEACVSVYIRAWVLDAAYLKPSCICQFQQDTQATLAVMQADFPNLCDIYSPVIHPLYEELRTVLGFQKTIDEHRPFYWVYLSLDRYLAVNVEQAIARLNLGDSFH